VKKNVAGQVVAFQAVSATDGSAVTTGTPTVYVTGDGGLQATGTGTTTHEGQGCWTYAPTQVETNYDHVAFTFVLTGAINQTVQVYTDFPQTGDSYAEVTNASYGLSKLVRSATPANALSVDASGLVDITQAAADKVWASTTRTLSSFGTLVADIWGYSTRTLTAFSTSLAVSVWDVLESAIATASSIGLKLKTNLDATVSSRGTSANQTTIITHLTDIKGTGFVKDTHSLPQCLTATGFSTHSAADVWAVGTRALTDKAGFSLTTAERDAIADAHLDRANGIETGLTPRQAARLTVAAAAGKLSGAATSTITIRDLADTKNRIVATVDADGNRTAITRDLT